MTTVALALGAEPIEPVNADQAENDQGDDAR
jgi:hypothetical protein